MALLLAAVRMFNERGFHATSLEDVAASLGVTKPVIYHHLGNKEQVLFECVRLGLEELALGAQAARETAGTGLDRLKTFLRSYAESVMGDFGKCAIRTTEESLSPQSYEKEHLPGAINIPKERVRELAPRLLPDKGAEIVVYCANLQCPSSTQTAQALQGLGYTNVADYEAGKADWIEAGLPVESGAPAEIA